jgi:hypothetical protein
LEKHYTDLTNLFIRMIKIKVISLLLV